MFGVVFADVAYRYQSLVSLHLSHVEAVLFFTQYYDDISFF